MSSLEKLAHLTAFICTFCASFLFLTGSHIPKYLILVFCLALVISFALKKDFHFKDFIEPYLDFISPWLPWFASILILSLFFHGVPQSKEFFNALLLMSVIFIALNFSQISRRYVILCLSVSLLIVSVLISTQVLMSGFGEGATVIGTNKNKVLGVTSILTISCLSSLLLEGKLYGNKEKSLLICTVVLSLAAIIIAEVRTAILPFLVLIPLLLVYQKKGRGKSIATVFIIVSALLALSFMTGRMQQGIMDLQQYSQGNSNSSWGIRIELWKLALSAFHDAPFFGWGSEPFDSIVNAGHVFNVKNFHPLHFHSDFLNALTIGGLFEVIFWLTSIILLFIKSRKDPASVCTLAALMAACMTDRYWFQRTTLFAFVTFWTLLYISAESRNRILTKQPSF